jgi:putative GTP pyrophosphokinase
VLSAPTISQVNKAGKTLRAVLRGEDPPPEAVDRALEVILRFRAAHQAPLIKATMGLRSRVKTVVPRRKLEVSQRLKRTPTILDKLERQPTLALSKMQDIGGCRAVVGSIAEIRRIQKRFDHKRPPLSVSDYIETPRDSGYRALHLVVEYDGFRIEVQIRTAVMHEWAVTVEGLGGQLGEDLKSGRGPAEILDLLEAASEAMALEEQGQEVDSKLLGRIRQLREEAAPLLPGGRRG